MHAEVKGLQDIIAGFENAVGASTFQSIGGLPNPGSKIAGGEITGGTFTTSGGVHDALGGELRSITGLLEKNGSLEISGGNYSGSLESRSIKGTGILGGKLEDGLAKIKSDMVERIENLSTLHTIFNSSFDNILNLNKNSDGEMSQSDIDNVSFVKDKILEAISREMQELQHILNTKIKPSKESIRELLKNNKSFSGLADALGVSYNTDEGSDRLAIAFTNLSDLGVTCQNIKSALKTLDMTLENYSKVKNLEDLNKKLASVMKKTKTGTGLFDKLNKIVDAVALLKNNQHRHSDIISCLKDDKKCIKNGRGVDGASETLGGSNNPIGRVKKNTHKSSIKKNMNTQEKAMKSIFSGFMSELKVHFKGIFTSIENVTEELGSVIPYDDKIKNFIGIYEGLGQDMSNSKIFYALIGLDNSLQSTEIKNRFTDNLNNSISSLQDLKSFRHLDAIRTQLIAARETIDTYYDTVKGTRDIASKVFEKDGKGDAISGGDDFFWAEKLVDSSITLNVAKLIQDSIIKLKFYGNLSMLKSNLLRTSKEYKDYSEDYDKLLGKSIGTKINELTKEYTENVERLNDKERGRGWLLEQWNNTKDRPEAAKIPRSLIETIYKLQYDARVGLYKTIEAIDLYLIAFTQELSNNVDAVKDLNKMLQQTEIIAKWFNEDSDKALKDLTAIISPTGVIGAAIVKKYLEKCKASIDSVAMLKNIISMFVHIGDKYGSKTLSKEFYMSPNIMYKNLIRYIWVSAFTMGNGSVTLSIPEFTFDANGAPKKDKNGYENEEGTIDTYFAMAFIILERPLELFKPCISGTFQKSNYMFVNDDKYFILALKAITGKILTVIATSNILKKPASIANMITNPVRMIIGGAKDVEVIDEAFELYIRLPLLVEFYKNVFENGNEPYKKNERANNDTEIIAYIPEIGSIWSGLIQCIFDESRYIKDGIYSVENMKRIILEINNIYKSYKNVDKQKLVRTAVLDLISDINKRYGVVKQQEINDFYQLKKKYVKTPGDPTTFSTVNFDILDENNEFEESGPSSQFTENSYKKSLATNDTFVTNDINLVKDFHNKISTELFKDTKITDLSKFSFTEKIKFYQNELKNNKNNESKLNLIINAIDDSSNINSHTDDVSMMFHEFVATPLVNLQAIRDILLTLFAEYLPRMSASLEPKLFPLKNKLLEEYEQIKETIPVNLYNNKPYSNATVDWLKNPTKEKFNKVTLLNFLNAYLHDNNLFSIRFINNNKFIIEYSKLQKHVENSIENIKYMISKFRSQLSSKIINQYENCLVEIEDILLIKMINNEDNNDIALFDLFNLDYLNKSIAFVLDSTKGENIGVSLYKTIMYNTKQKLNDKKTLSDIIPQSVLFKDVFIQYKGGNRNSWVTIDNIGNPSDNKADNFNHLQNVYCNLTDKYWQDMALLFTFNSLVYEYLNTFYDASAKKIYSNLFNEFVNKSQSNSIFNNNGIPDIFSNKDKKGTLPNGLDSVLTNIFIENDSVLCESLGYMFKTFVNRTVNVQLPTKKHLIINLSEVSPNIIEKYKVYLPIFIKLFELLIQKALLCKKIIETTEDNQINDGDILDSPLNEGTRKIPGDIAGEEQEFTGIWVTGTTQRSVHFNNILNGIIDASRSLINDATNVIAELNHKQQYFELKENFIKNFYNNTEKLPMMPMSLTTLILNNTILESPNLLIPYQNKSDFETKYLYGINSIINNPSLDSNINNFIWLKEILKNYNNSSLSVNKIDIDKVNSYLEYNNSITISLSTILFYNRIINVKKSDFQLSKMPKDPNSVCFSNTYYTALKNNIIVNAISMVDNTSIDNNKQIISKTITDTKSEFNLSRNNARFLNILDLNIVPINVHALMREIPLINIYNYAFTYDSLVKKELNQPDIEAMCEDIQVDNKDTTLCHFLLDPYARIKTANTETAITTLSNEDSPLGRAKFISDKLKDAVGNNNNKFNCKFIRNMLFLANLQRFINHAIKKEVEHINTKVVTDMAIINSKITSYDKDKEYEKDEFEYILTE